MAVESVYMILQVLKDAGSDERGNLQPQETCNKVKNMLIIVVLECNFWQGLGKLEA